MDSEQVEIVARAIAVARGDDPSELLLNLETGATDQPLWECYLPEARAAIAAYRPLVIERCAEIADAIANERHSHLDYEESLVAGGAEEVATALRSMKEQGA